LFLHILVRRGAGLIKVNDALASIAEVITRSRVQIRTVSIDLLETTPQVFVLFPLGFLPMLFSSGF
jgi:hypothetical protein